MKQGEGTAKNAINKRRSRNYELGEEGSTCCTKWNMGRSSLGLAPQCRKCLLHSHVQETLREYGPTEDRSEDKEGIKVVLERTNETPHSYGARRESKDPGPGTRQTKYLSIVTGGMHTHVKLCARLGLQALRLTCPGASTWREPGSTRDSYTECVSQLLRGKGVFVYTYICATNRPSPFISQSSPWVKLLVLPVLVWVQNISACIHFCSWPCSIKVCLYQKDMLGLPAEGGWTLGTWRCSSLATRFSRPQYLPIAKYTECYPSFHHVTKGKKKRKCFSRTSNIYQHGVWLWGIPSAKPNTPV